MKQFLLFTAFLLTFCIKNILAYDYTPINSSFMSFTYSDYPKFFGESAIISSSSGIYFEHAFVSLAYADINNIVYTVPKANPKNFAPSTKLDNYAYSSFSNFNFDREYLKYNLPLNKSFELVVNLEYFRSHSLFSLNDIANDTHKKWYSSQYSGHGSDFRNDIAPYQKKSYFLIDQDKSKIVYEADPNKLSNTIGSLNLQLKQAILTNENYSLSTLYGFNLADGLLNRISAIGHQGDKFDLNLLLAGLLDIKFNNYVYYNGALIVIYKDRSYLTRFLNRLVGVENNFQFNLANLINGLKFSFTTDIMNDFNSLNNGLNWQFDARFSYDYKNSYYAISFYEDNGNYSSSNIDFAGSLSAGFNF